LPEFARICQNLPEFARICQKMPENARKCQNDLSRKSNKKLSGGFWRILADSGGVWRTKFLADSGGFWRILADSGGFWRT
jgi:hypothetical protein